MNDQKCKCEILPIHYSNYSNESVGTDYTNGRYGEVTIKTCIHCQQLWLSYSVEYESFSRSGRWFLGKITKADIRKLKPVKAQSLFKKMEWYFYGGSYFNGSGTSSGIPKFDL